MDDEFKFFQEWWKILRKYWNPPEKNESKQAVEFWYGLTRECMALHKKYESNKIFEPFALKMVVELIAEIERRSKIDGR